MNKKFIAKLLALGLILAMLPTAAFAARVNGLPSNNSPYYWDAANKTYYYFTEDTNSDVGGSTDSTDSTGSTGEADMPEVIDTVEAVKEDQVKVAEDGAVTVTIEATVEEGAASVLLTDEVVESLAEQVEGDSLTLVVETEDATKVSVTMPGKALAAMAEKTGAALTVESAVATITIPNEALKGTALKDAQAVAVCAEVDDNGYIAIAVLADGKAVTKDIKGLVVKF